MPTDSTPAPATITFRKTSRTEMDIATIRNLWHTAAGMSPLTDSEVIRLALGQLAFSLKEEKKRN